jgi:hypothetical protein
MTMAPTDKLTATLEEKRDVEKIVCFFILFLFDNSN